MNRRSMIKNLFISASLVGAGHYGLQWSNVAREEIGTKHANEQSDANQPDVLESASVGATGAYGTLIYCALERWSRRPLGIN